MRFGVVILPQYPWPEARRRWRKAEELGFDHAWTYDHLSWRTLADQPWGATVPLLTAAATATERIRLGTFVTSPNFRHPVPFAKDLAGVDEIAGGRFLLGIGSGGTGFDAFVLGQPELSPRERHERFVEFTRDLDVLLRFEQDGPLSFDGPRYRAVDARMVGEPAQNPRMPFVLAANGPKGLRLVAELGQGWVTTGPDGDGGDAWWSRVAGLSQRLDDALDAAGRDRGTVDRYLSIDSGGTYSLSSSGAADDAVGRAAELGFTDVILHWPRDGEPYEGTEAALDAFAERHLS
ncbi:LLM class flavin-dependent oxidoreductase [Tsukamurella ocularis]|uniref:LLM class flavin-dependent oxidoreductase n=1 Tax=Tsukamurella ocularis TaxID=1970234 RepID=UPI002169ABA8|nr:LLM class flavin-dependent oxidoreductase [Tsukamurella ocularis]MCS3779252.1 alkanesulfonate monooxygenase SsuD/methylene tetrahydromethanopterin reductase-like flavin-dependent oxidoreductase (luciferase family) [Tsukamurella ocularis]MCS3787128.1 alkanesulfonate monooxygenase SsuD/methylene tetrahydromethanopterin reductase-like flavin-dependent oxidoreductase (luciferase family) [Tsukamurella ocularis]MCS3852519.1 alkanesulfonate monooxygenase SsuD/methylene tetrahydromethanopterin reduct